MDDIEIQNLAAEAIESKKFFEAQRLLEPLVAHDLEYALMTLGWMHEIRKANQSDNRVAISLYRRAADIGCLQAYNCLGRVLLAEGELVKARDTYMVGAELGHLGCMTWLGSMMFSGQGGKKDAENGLLWFRKAAEKGHYAAQVKLLYWERDNSKSFFRYIVFVFKLVALLRHQAKDYFSDPYADKFH
jgi:TPR repeat protein